MKIGDRVRLVGQVHIKGSILKVKPNKDGESMKDEYLIEYDKPNGPINKAWHTSTGIMLINDTKKIELKKCTCGLDSTRHGGLHSNWCDLAKETG